MAVDVPQLSLGVCTEELGLYRLTFNINSRPYMLIIKLGYIFCFCLQINCSEMQARMNNDIVAHYYYYYLQYYTATVHRHLRISNINTM